LQGAVPGADPLDASFSEIGAARPLREMADRVMDTTRLTVPTSVATSSSTSRPIGTVLKWTTRWWSFGSVRAPGLRRHRFDARFLPNPHFVPALRPRTGKSDVAAFVFEKPEGREFLDALDGFMAPVASALCRAKEGHRSPWPSGSPAGGPLARLADALESGCGRTVRRRRGGDASPH